MRLSESIIWRTGQGTKAVIALAGLLSGGAAVYLGGLAYKSFPDSIVVVIAQLGGALFGLAAMFFACRSIRCPGCGTRWIWDTMSKESASRWMFSLLDSKTCPKCGHPDGVAASGSPTPPRGS
jgi:hypothetical protein